ncbi:hypothetical protein [Sphingorhabdus sp.]|uniref:ImuA family protein n=1 Tax=Sphingorhabdus sp. TaxID=1902408 RepID=UPI0032B881E1
MKIAPLVILGHSPPEKAPRRAFGIASLDAALAGGLAGGRVHEIYPSQKDDAAAAMGLAVAMATGIAEGGNPVMWLRSRRAVHVAGVFQANGWAELGGTPGNTLVGVVSDMTMLLRAAVDALRCPALGAVIVEGWGRIPELDLTASRRLALAAEKSGVPLFLLRCDTQPAPSAAQTRWAVAAAPSRALPGNAPGRPTFDITLLRQRSGPCGLAWRLEWDRDQHQFREAEVSSSMVSVPVRRPIADAGSRSPDSWIVT